MAINGNLYDWESVEVQLPHGVTVGLTDIGYTDERGIEARYGKGSIPRAFGRKNYKATGSGTLDKDEFERLRVGLGGSVYTKAPFVIVISYANQDQPVITDTLPDVLITKVDTSSQQEDDNAGTVKLDFIILSPIKWNGIPAYTSGRNGSLGI
ncbi:hypothetical protein [Maridesulfovibrio bastinii]|uniref:hypothetical protein n=1 Tax=Maridesulfovibrio bastinii TaxID=47157 RepID=UPI00040372CB|nr:hypothetical protein [Maridesulfovibrio bastinii]